jgi:Na+/H+-dicarboxylate symporter
MGDLFLRALKMIIVPLILSSIVSGVANLGSGESLGRLGIKTLTYYLSTSTFAIIVGLLFVNLLQPGVGSDLGLSKSIEELAVTKQSFGDTLLKIVPENIFDSFLQGDMLSIIFFSIIFGYFITKVDKKYSTQLTDFFNSTFEVMMKITLFIIKFAPLGILGIVAGIVAEQAGNTEALIDMVGRLGIYMLAVLFALAVHAGITLPLILKFVGKVNPWLHFKAMTTPLLTAFSTSSSNATLPLTMEAVESEVGVSNEITSFTLPLGATVNMDGTALYECVAAMFIAQAYGVELGFLEQVIVVLTALLASIGAAGIPMAGLVTITIILSAVGLPLEGVGLILSVDRILDMCRTTVNVWSDSCGAAVIAKTEGETLKIE